MVEYINYKLNKTMNETSFSPKIINPEKPATVKEGMDFPEAVKKIMEGYKVTRLEWEDERTYGILSNTKLSIHLSNESANVFHEWIVSDGDLFGTDWKVV